MTLKSLILEQNIEDLAFIMLENYLNVVDTNHLTESVDNDCKYRGRKIKDKDNNLKYVHGLKGITDELMRKIKTKSDLEKLINRINAKSDVLQDTMKCKKAVIARYMELHKENDKKNFKDGDSCQLPEFDVVLKKIKKIIKYYISKAKKWNIKIDFKESIETNLITLASANILMEVNISEILKDTISLLEGCNVAKLSKYIITLRGIKKELSGLVSPSEEKELDNAIKEFTAHYHKFNNN